MSPVKRISRGIFRYVDSPLSTIGGRRFKVTVLAVDGYSRSGLFLVLFR